MDDIAAAIFAVGMDYVAPGEGSRDRGGSSRMPEGGSATAVVDGGRYGSLAGAATEGA